MNRSAQPFVFVILLGVACASLLTGAEMFTRPYRLRNQRADSYRALFDVLGVPYDPDASSQRLIEVFKENVAETKGGGLTLYWRVGPGGRRQAVAVPLNGAGLWGPIEGFLALQPDLRTIRAVTFHKQEETPGLGGKIGTRDFQQRFRGKRIVGPDGRPGMRVAAGAADAPNGVDAISGATMTSDKVERLINKTVGTLLGERQDGDG